MLSRNKESSKNGWKSGQDATQEIKCGFFFQSCNCTSHQKPVQTDEVQNKDLQNLDVVDKQQKLTSDSSPTLSMVSSSNMWQVLLLSSCDIMWGTYRRRLLTQMSAYDNSSKPVKRMMTSRVQGGTVILEFTGLICTGNPTHNQKWVYAFWMFSHT